jgi:hypothetical protein
VDGLVKKLEGGRTLTRYSVYRNSGEARNARESVKSGIERQDLFDPVIFP